jgi:hypothetical protein
MHRPAAQAVGSKLARTNLDFGHARWMRGNAQWMYGKAKGLRACFRNPRKRRVRARGLQKTRRFWPHCRPDPITGRFLKQALSDRNTYVTHLSLVALRNADRNWGKIFTYLRLFPLILAYLRLMGEKCLWRRSWFPIWPRHAWIGMGTPGTRPSEIDGPLIGRGRIAALLFFAFWYGWRVQFNFPRTG